MVPSVLAPAAVSSERWMSFRSKTHAICGGTRGVDSAVAKPPGGSYAVAKASYLARNRRTNPRQLQAARRLVCGYLLEHPCVGCRESDIVVLEFNHRDPLSKLANISDMILRLFSPTRI
jgi:hypothetical protein